MLLVWMIGTGIWVAVEMGIGPRLQLDYKYCTNIAMPDDAILAQFVDTRVDVEV